MFCIACMIELRHSRDISAAYRVFHKSNRVVAAKEQSGQLILVFRDQSCDSRLVSSDQCLLR